jgi:SAM-dependent methyltransferase
VKETTQKINRQDNKLRPEDQPVHDWYRFVLSFPPHLVRNYLHRFGVESGNRVLDPFCGTGTTLVECKKLGIGSVGVEPNPVGCFVTGVKVNWTVEIEKLLSHAQKIARSVLERLRLHGINDWPLPLSQSTNGRNGTRKLRTLPSEASDLLLKNSISPLPLHKILLLLDAIKDYRDERFTNHEKLAAAKIAIADASNLHFGPEVGVATRKQDAAVVDPWMATVRRMARDLTELRHKETTPALVYRNDARNLSRFLEPRSVDAVITSPPYPNEKDYTRTTRLEAVLLGFIRNKPDLRSLKQDLIRSNTRNVFKGDGDDDLVADHDEIQRVALAIERRRVELRKTSGFERLYARVTKLYFGGMARHLAELRAILRPGAQLAYVVGDQASFFQVMIRTGQLLAEIAETLGYQVADIELFRTRIATATRAELREEVVLLRWPGSRSSSRGIGVNRYASVIEKIFHSNYTAGMREVDFEPDDIISVSEELKINPPKNLGDLIYSFRYRAALPESIQQQAPEGEAWIIRGVGPAKYRFVLVANVPLAPNPNIAETKVPDATPGVVAKYALSDKQALLARLRYNRLVDIFTGVACYSLQNHLRTTVPDIGQVETDELYIGVDKKGIRYVIPIQAKGGKDKLSIVQIEQDLALCSAKFSSLICRPLAAQFMKDDLIALFEFEQGDKGVAITSEKHYKLVPPDDVSDGDLEAYRSRKSD